ncbi:MAG: hypothetical protein WBB85_06555 [Albidovulum sp.]|uniref:hypothetical protein n=1 Tax=Albidovulum sp. TaxID=1872424 RepID=UPI003C9DADA5
MWASKALVLPVLLCIGTGLSAANAQSDAPMSAIDWLSKSVASPAIAIPGIRNEPPVTDGAAPRTIVVRPIDGPSLDGLGLLSVAKTGLPRDLWGTTSSAELARLIRAERINTLPAIQSLLYTLMLAEVAPPADSDGSGAIFLARVDKLLDLGALDPALALLEMTKTPEPEPFRRWFDIALLIGREDRACDIMLETPQIAPTFPARIFCLARSGDWNAAALSLRTGETLGFIEPEMAALLERFLDPELFEGEPDLPMPARPSPLVLRLMEAIGQPLPTTTLPLAFAQADLRSNAGWKTRLEAGERLARTGAIEPNRLLGLYTERKAAASGGVWERVDAIQRLEAALGLRDAGTIGRLLPDTWAMMVEAELEVPFAALYGSRLAGLDLSGDAGLLAFRIGLLSADYESIARAHTPQDAEERFLIGLATGSPLGMKPPDQLGAAIQRAFLPAPRPSDAFSRLLDEKRLGEALLLGIDHITEGARGELRDVTDGLELLRHVGLETTARRAALELVLLERRG